MQGSSWPSAPPGRVLASVVKDNSLAGACEAMPTVRRNRRAWLQSFVAVETPQIQGISFMPLTYRYVHHVQCRHLDSVRAILILVCITTAGISHPIGFMFQFLLPLEVLQLRLFHDQKVSRILSLIHLVPTAMVVVVVVVNSSGGSGSGSGKGSGSGEW